MNKLGAMACIEEYKKNAECEQTRLVQSMSLYDNILPLFSKWLLNPCPTFNPPLGFWDISVAFQVVCVDGRFITHLPAEFARTRKIQRTALLHLLRLGVKGSAVKAKRPFLQAILSNVDVLRAEWPKRLVHPGERRSAFWKLLSSSASDIQHLLELDGRNLRCMPTDMRNCDIYVRASSHRDIARCGVPYATARLRDCCDFMAYAINKRPTAYLHCSARLRSVDLYLLRLALEGGFKTAMYCTHSPLRTSIAAGVAAIWVNRGLKGLPSDLRFDSDYLCKLAPECGSLILNGLNESLLNNSEFREKIAQERSLGCVVTPHPKVQAHKKRPLKTVLSNNSKRARLRDVLHCAICLDTVQGKVQQCRLGHIFCASCISKMPGGVEFVCPQCRMRQSRFVLARCLVSERLRDLLVAQGDTCDI